MYTLRRLPWTIIIALICYTAILMGNWLLVYKPNQAIQSTWLAHSEQLKQQSVIIGRLAHEFGYSGFIHHFKNYVIRREAKYLDSANRSLTQTNLLIKQLMPLYLDHDPEQLGNLSQLETTAQQYETKVAWIHSNRFLSDQLSVDALDELLYVDDNNAARALLALFDDNQSSIENATAFTSQLYRKSSAQSLVWLLTLSLLYWISVGYLLQKNRRIRDYSRHLTAINDLSPSAMVMIDQQGRVLSANLKFKKMFAVPLNTNLANMTIEDFLPESFRHKHKGHRDAFFQTTRTSAMEDRASEFFGQRLNGEIFPADISIAVLDDNEHRKVIAIIQDKSHEFFLAEQANTDYLTKASNRKFAEEQLGNEIYRYNRYGDPLCILLIDIDHFKKINDTHGHSAGDHVLISVVNNIEKNLRQTDILARWGGDEFMVILPNTPLVQAKDLAKKLIVLTKKEFESSELNVTLSIGLAQVKPKQSANSLIKMADAALYVSKGNGRNQVSTLQFSEDETENEKAP